MWVRLVCQALEDGGGKQDGNSDHPKWAAITSNTPLAMQSLPQ